MAKFMNNVYKNSSWIIIVLAMVGYFFFQTMNFNGSIEAVLTNPKEVVHLLFVVFLNVTVVSAANDSGFSVGLQSEEFALADEVNNRIIQSVNNDMDDFRAYVKKLNAHELILIQEDYLFSIGDKKVEELTPKELKQYNRLKPIQHDIYGFNLPLHHTVTKDKKVSYSASYDKNKGKKTAMIKKVGTGLLFGAMTVNMIFNWDGVGNALVSLLVISSGLVVTFIMQYTKPMFALKYELPKKVIFKKTLYDSFRDFKNGKVVLNETRAHVEETKKEEIVVNNEITEIKEP